MSDDASVKKVIQGLKSLKTTGEGGTKLDFEDFKDKISNYFVQNKKDGADIAHLISEREDPTFEEPLEPTGDDAKKTLNMRRYERQLDVFLKEKKDTRGIRKLYFLSSGRTCPKRHKTY